MCDLGLGGVVGARGLALRGRRSARARYRRPPSPTQPLFIAALSLTLFPPLSHRPARVLLPTHAGITLTRLGAAQRQTPLIPYSNKMNARRRDEEEEEEKPWVKLRRLRAEQVSNSSSSMRDSNPAVSSPNTGGRRRSAASDADDDARRSTPPLC